VARLPYLTLEDAPPTVAGPLGKLPPLHVFQLVAHAESAFVPWLKLGGAILADLALDPALRELAILQVGRLAARYEWDQHVPIALNVGVTQDEIDALDSGRVEAFTPERQTVLKYVQAFVSGAVDDGLHTAVAHHLSDREIVELCIVAGHYLGLARAMSALRIDPDPAAGPETLRRLSALRTDPETVENR
jgi:alkylhydroperoxidase family enzyme